MVSILVVMERTRRLADCMNESCWTQVSILVVMERTRRRRDAWLRRLHDRDGFNPCCDGTDSSTATQDESNAFGIQVSILVVMERTRRPRVDCCQVHARVL